MCNLLHEIFAYLQRAAIIEEQEAFEKCWAHSQLRAAARRLL